MQTDRRQALRDAALIFVLALGPRLILALSLPANDTVFWDQPYWEYARNFSEGRGFWMANPYGPPLDLPRVYAFRPPLFPFLWGCVFSWTHGAYLPVRAAHAVLGAMTCALAYLAGMEMTRRRAIAAVAGILCAFYPPLIWHSVHLMTEPLFIFLSVLCIYAAFVFRRAGRLRWAVAAGFAGALAALTRSMFIGFLPLLAVWVGWSGRRTGRAWSGAAAFCAAVLLALAPWTIRNAIVLQAFLPTTTDAGHGFYVANNEHSLAEPGGFWTPKDWSFVLKPGEKGIGEVEVSRRLARLAGEYLWSHPAAALRLMARRFTTLWGFYPNPQFMESRGNLLIYALAYIPLFPLMLFGLWLAHRQSSPERLPDLLLVDALVLYTTAVHVVILAMMRYREPLMPYLLVFAAAGIVGALKKGERRIPNAE